MADPRLERPQTVNEEIRNRSIRHLLFLTQYGNHEVREILRFINNDLQPDILAQLQKRLSSIDDRGITLKTKTLDRINNLIREINEITDGGFVDYRQEFRKRLVDLAKEEAEFAVASVPPSVKAQVAMVAPSVPMLASAALHNPMDGKVFNDWFKDLSLGTKTRIGQAVRIGMAQGETGDEMIRRVRGTRALRYTDGIIQPIRNQASAIVRSLVIHASVQAREATFAANRDLVKGVVWVSTLDNVSCPVCGSLDGQVFPVGEGPRPPIHVGCRCGINPALVSARELGITLPPGTRSSMDGEVPDTLTYPEWLKTQPAHEQDRALGKTRGALFRRGGLSVGSFVNEQGRILNLEQLRQLERDAFERANL